jgi:diguanylate cyclase (GGDEF)-like protein
LLEVTKLLSARVDVGTFAPAALEVLTQFAPVDSCSIRIEAPEVPAAHAIVGVFSDQDDSDLFASAIAGAIHANVAMKVSTLTAGDSPVGYLAATNLADAIAGSELIEKVAQQISSGLDALIEAERTRRQLAASRALEIVSHINESYSVTELAQFVNALAVLPKAVGATLLLQNPRFGGPTTASAGTVTDVPVRAHVVEIERRVTMTVELHWAAEPDDTDLTPFIETVDSLAAALGRVERNLRLTDEVETDELTGVGNRRRALRVLSTARSWAEREERCFSVLIFDLDNFKNVNDTLGHGTGDQVLAQFAALLSGSIREYDSVARWGGEEFLVICPDTDTHQAERLAQRLLEAVPDGCASVLPADWNQTASIGVASYPMHGENPTAVVNAADEALYQSKREGRNRATVAAMKPAARVVGGRPR